jgi:hypothetical protein
MVPLWQLHRFSDDDERGPDRGVGLVVVLCIVQNVQLRPPPYNASGSACGGDEFASATLSVETADADAATASVGLDSVLSRGCCVTEAASLCSMGFAAADGDAATTSVGLDSVLSCGCCVTEAASLCSIGFAAAVGMPRRHQSVWIVCFLVAVV